MPGKFDETPLQSVERVHEQIHALPQGLDWRRSDFEMSFSRA
jgi:hypothetical protein